MTDHRHSSTDDARHAAEAFPSSHASWRHCIEHKCGIALTSEYVLERIATLTDPRSEETRRLAVAYGDRYLMQVVAWFQQAADQLGARADRTRV
ncbi:MAG: hypothetical protein N838_12935 [Thiohalocapsa sp. PB-PSB1]|jgi:hypothetical protein|nr:MAG: hypothetical protein N838_29390 [Thiohalocapsa sp. PB-PSB1]QQO54114.1 MAG: hypothetical protein N838_12935 [Thiohalocapsa sp. PB-PSB1]HCS92870.1 hypothetical protein [Chromatiaceae bacterium]